MATGSAGEAMDHHIHCQPIERIEPWRVWRRAGSICERSGIEVVDGRTGLGHKADHTTAALLRDRVEQLTITGAVEILVPKGGLIAIHCFWVFYRAFSIFLGKLHFLTSAPTAPAALCAPGCTLVVPNLFLTSVSTAGPISLLTENPPPLKMSMMVFPPVRRSHS